MHETQFEPLVNYLAIVKGFLFGSLIYTFLYPLPAGLNIVALFFALFLVFDACIPEEEPPYIIEFLLSAIPGIVLAVALSPITFLYTALMFIITVLFVFRRILTSIR